MTRGPPPASNRVHELFSSRLPGLVRRWLYIAAGGCLALVWAYGFWQLAQFRQLTLAQSERHLLTVAISVSQHLDAMINDGVGAAVAAIRMADVEGVSDVTASPDLERSMAAGLSRGNYVQGLFVYANGRYRQVDRTDAATVISAPGWLQAIDSDPQATAWAGTLIPECAPNHVGCIPVARKVTTRAGHTLWAGALLNVNSIEASHERLPLREGVIALVSTRGYVIARVPPVPFDRRQLDARVYSRVRARMHTDSTEPVELVGPVTGVPMIYEVRHVTGLPLVVAAGAPKSAVLASWSQQLQSTVALLTAATVLLVLLGWQLRRSLIATEQRESQLRVLFDQSPLGIVLSDGQRVVGANRAAHELFGAGTRLEGLPVSELTPEIQADGQRTEELRRLYHEGMRAGHGMKFQTVVQRLDGIRVPVEISISSQRFGADGVLAIVRDLSDIERANAELAQLNATLEHRVQERTEALQLANADLLSSNRELEAFASSASHDLRAPLTTISAMAGILREEVRAGSTAAVERRVDRIQAAVLRMTEIIEGLLTLAGMTTQTLRREEVNLSELAVQIAQELRAEYPALQVDFHCDPELTVRADPRLMATLLNNLLSNAWKYSSYASGPRIELRQQASAVNEMEYVVADNGAGFDMQQAQHLFQPFHRMHSQRDYPGIGLGLAIAQRVVQRYGGKIWAHSTPGEGAAFHFTLPGAQPSRHTTALRDAG